MKGLMRGSLVVWLVLKTSHSGSARSTIVVWRDRIAS